MKLSTFDSELKCFRHVAIPQLGAELGQRLSNIVQTGFDFLRAQPNAHVMALRAMSFRVYNREVLMYGRSWKLVFFWSMSAALVLMLTDVDRAHANTPTACVRAEKLKQQGKDKQAAVFARRCQSAMAQRKSQTNHVAKKRPHPNGGVVVNATVSSRKPGRLQSKKPPKRHPPPPTPPTASRKPASYPSAAQAPRGAAQPNVAAPRTAPMQPPVRPTPHLLSENGGAAALQQALNGQCASTPLPSGVNDARYVDALKEDAALARSKNVSPTLGGVTVGEPLALQDCVGSVLTERPEPCKRMSAVNVELSEGLQQLAAFAKLAQGRPGSATSVRLSQARPNWLDPLVTVYTAQGHTAAVSSDFGIPIGAEATVIASLGRSYGNPSRVERDSVTERCMRHVEAPRVYHWFPPGLHVVYTTASIVSTDAGYNRYDEYDPDQDNDLQAEEQRLQMNAASSCVTRPGSLLFAADTYSGMVKDSMTQVLQPFLQP